VKSIDPFDFKNEFRQMANGKLNASSDNLKMIGKADLLDTVHKALMNQSTAI